MQKAKIISISLPPAICESLRDIAIKEHRSVSEVVREALRLYQKAHGYMLSVGRKISVKKDVRPQ